jgi:hypothetical protein
MKRSAVLEPEILQLGAEDFADYEQWSDSVNKKMDSEENYTVCLNFIGDQDALEACVDLYVRDNGCSREEALSIFAAKTQSGEFYESFEGAN